MDRIEKRTPWAWTIATFFGAGNMKPGPGTYGSVTAMLLWLGAAHVLHPTVPGMTLGTVVAAVLATAIGVKASTIVAREAGREDPGFVVIDEVAGQWIALLGMKMDWKHALLALLLFRLFDIFKPWPIRKFEDFPEGQGIMYDDVVAGVFALVTGLLLVHFVPVLQ